jgi:hypothetical protein
MFCHRDLNLINIQAVYIGLIFDYRNVGINPYLITNYELRTTNYLMPGGRIGKSHRSER